MTPVSLPGATELLVPAWGGDGGLNDRFSVAGPIAALAFGSRLGVLRDFTRGLAGESRLTLDYCAELVTNAFRLTPSARQKDAPEDSLLAGGSKACLVHYNGPSKFFWRGKLSS